MRRMLGDSHVPHDEDMEKSAPRAGRWAEQLLHVARLRGRNRRYGGAPARHARQAQKTEARGQRGESPLSQSRDGVRTG